MFICFPFESTGEVVKSLMVFIFLMYLYVLGFAKLIMLTQKYNVGWYIMTTVYYKFMCYIFFPTMSLIFFIFFGVLLYNISYVFETHYNYAMVSLFSTFILTFIGMYIYMNVFSSCVYLMFLKISHVQGCRKLSYHLQFKTRNTFQIFPFMKSCIGHMLFKFFLLFILLIIETVVFYETYQDVFFFLNTTKPFEIMDIFCYIDQVSFIDVIPDIFHFILAIGLLKHLQRYRLFTTDFLVL